MVEAPATITLVGTVQGFRRSRVGSEISGIVETMPARQGDLVEAGGVLCTLNQDALSLRLAEAKAKLSALKARHKELQAGTRKEELTRLKALLDEAVAERDRWDFEMKRIEKLYEGRESNPREYYDTRAEALTSEQRRIAAEALYQLGLAGPREEVVAQAAFDVAQQQAIVSRFETDLAKAVIRAPFTGYITERRVEIGEWVPTGGQTVEMIDVAKVLVRVEVPEYALSFQTVGSTAPVGIDALKRSFDGHIKHVVPKADPTARTFPVEIEINNPEGLLADGMFARVTVASGPKKTVLAVPKDAIVERDGINYVAVVMPGKKGGFVGILTPVTVGSDIDEWISISSEGITPGTRVITRGNEQVRHFPTPVMIVDETGTPVDPAPGARADGSSHAGPKIK